MRDVTHESLNWLLMRDVTHESLNYITRCSGWVFKCHEVKSVCLKFVQGGISTSSGGQLIDISM